MTAPRPACRSGRWLATIAIWPTNVEVTRNSVTSWATERLPPEASATPATAMPASSAWSRTPARRTRRLSTSTTALNFACTSAESRATPSDDVRLAEAGAQVVATGDPLLEHGGVVGPRHLLDDLATRDLTEQRPDGEPRDAREHREEEEGRPPGDAGDHPHRQGAEEGAGEHPDLPPHQVADFVGVVVDPVEDLAHCLLAQRGQRLAQRRPEQVLAQPALRAVRTADPGDLPGGVDHGRTNQADREQPDQAAGRVLGELPGHDGAECHPDCSHRGGGQRGHRHRALQP